MMGFVIDMDAYLAMKALAPEEGRAFDDWMHGEDLTQMMVTEIDFDGEGTALITHALRERDGKLKVENGEVVYVVDRVDQLQSLPPIDLARWTVQRPNPQGA